MEMITDEGRAIANLLSCKLDEFPISYSGLPIRNKNLCRVDSKPQADKVAKRVEP